MSDHGQSGVPDFAGDDHAVTISLPVCERHPRMVFWPSGNLVRGICPECGQFVDDGPAAARVLRSRRLIEEREQ